MTTFIKTLWLVLFAATSVASIGQSTESLDPTSVIVLAKPEYRDELQAVVLGQTMRASLLSPTKSIKPPTKVKVLHKGGKTPIYLLQWNEPQPITSLISSLKTSGAFDIVEPNYVGSTCGQEICTPPNNPNDDELGQQWSLNNDGSFDLADATPQADIRMLQAWEIETGSSDVIVAVLDTGDPAGHPELRNRFWTNETGINGEDDDGNGYVDDTRGYDFVDESPFPTDRNGHGTNVAGIIVAEANNSRGFAGVDWNCKLMTLKVLDDDGFGLYSDWVEAIYYATDNGARVINMSLSGLTYSSHLQDAVNYANDNGVLVVAAMGNRNTTVPEYPAALDNVLSVGSTDPDDTRTEPFYWSNNSGSNYGPHIDLVAPGNYIYGLNHRRHTLYNTYWGGTSQAAPHVVGVATLLLAQDNTRTPADLRQLITSTADDQVGDVDDIAGYDLHYGHGRLNAYKALQAGAGVISNVGEVLPDLWEMSPNPLQQGVSIRINTSTSGRQSVNIYDMAGHLIRSSVFDGNRVVLTSDDLPSGIYVVSLLQDAKVSSRKLVVQ